LHGRFTLQADAQLLRATGGSAPIADHQENQKQPLNVKLTGEGPQGESQR